MGVEELLRDDMHSSRGDGEEGPGAQLPPGKISGPLRCWGLQRPQKLSPRLDVSLLDLPA